jgi:hypothetical protein
LPKSVFSIGEFSAGYQKVQSSHKVLKDAWLILKMAD